MARSRSMRSTVGRRGELEREGLEATEDGADLPELDGIEGADAESSAHGVLEGAVPAQPEQGFAHRRPADAELGGEVGIPDSAAGARSPR